MRNFLILSACFSLILISGCESKFTERAKEAEQKRIENKKEEPKELTPETVELSEEQQKALDNLEKKEAEEALFENDLDIRKELKKDVPPQKESYENPEELSQFLGYLFYAYHTKKMNHEDYYKTLLPHMHTQYLSMLPKEEKNRISSFKSLQNLFIEQLPALINDYVITELQYQDRSGEATFYRKYELSNKKIIQKRKEK